jgi:spore coat polysaccharide biosynthesis protein SpsF
MYAKNSANVVAVIEARMASSRLPGKVLLKASGKPMLEHLVTRLRAVTTINSLVLATTINESDDVLESFAKNVGIDCFRGSEQDVLERVIGAAESAYADVVVGITGDCPIIDPIIVEHTIRMFMVNNCDYVSNGHIRSFPDGMDTRVCSLETLKRSSSMTTNTLDREHVSLHIRNHPELFKHLYVVAPQDLNWPELGLTLDEKKDYDLLRKIIEYFENINPLFGCREVIELLRNNPDWIMINQSVKRKGNT